MFIELLVFDYSVEKLTSRAGLHHDVNVLAVDVCLMELDNVRMI